MYKWQTLETEDVSPHDRWMPVFRDKVRLHDGRIMDDFYFARLGKIAIILPILKTREIVFIRQYRHAAKEVTLELPAGMVEGERSVEEVAVNELEEEVGIKIEENELVSLGKTIPVPHKLDMTIYGFFAKDLEFNSKQHLEPDENIEIVPIQATKVFDMIKAGEIYQSDTISFLTIAREKFPDLFSK